ncbi:putative T7SS-secreted protein [Streptomyces sp. SCSIO ZS0520]|uniref:putative T7SS-secreted protein n=1 Tax=Streptomyces sp. SCSIO ZS0520 TaxID=2892996 RepID=UPI0021D7F807|nr:HNH/endonuclease VII fold putative polymorphic toxin [Streptomyces sp. SCSIO ZS0520]
MSLWDDAEDKLKDKATDVANDAAGAVEDGIDKVKKGVGEGVAEGGHAVGDWMRDRGVDGAADAVDAAADSLASRLGADVPEKQLDESDNPRELIHGSAGKVRGTAKNLSDFATAFEAVGLGMRSVDSTSWQGEAAGAFRKKFGLHPQKWLRAADACKEAGQALSAYAEVIEWAQTRAGEAVEAWAKGERASGRHQKDVAAYRTAALAGDTEGLTRPPETDPGEAAKEAARELLAGARRQRDRAGETAARLVKAALEHAPKEPPPLSRLRDDAGDAFAAADTEAAHLGSGALKGAAGMVNAARMVNPLDPYNLLHPGDYGKNVQTTVNSVAYSTAHPQETLAQMVAALRDDPAEFAGRLLPEAVGTKGAGILKKGTAFRRPGGHEPGPEAPGLGTRPPGDSPTELARATGELADALDGLPKEGPGGPDRTDLTSAERLTDAFDDSDGAPGGRERGEDPGSSAESAEEARHRSDQEPGSENPEKSSGDTDPVDMVSGKMFLPTTDVALPGALPLVFTRRVESGYRLGRWFGPSWSSTLDQCLRIDARGVLFAREDGTLLSYPHPAPGVPVLPERGARWALDRVDGGYTVTDPATGRTWHFADQDEHLAVLEQIDDRNGNWITFAYDAEGTPLGLTHSAGHRLRITAAEGRVRALHLSGGADDGTDLALIRYGYTDGNLTEVVNSSGLPLRFTYDERGRVTSWTDTNDRAYHYAYDERDRCVAEGGTEGHLSLTLAYEDTDPGTGLRTTTTTSAAGHSRRFHIDAEDRIVAETDPLGATTRWTHDRHGRVLTRTDPLGHTTSFAYDEHGNLTEAIRPDGRRATVAYGELGLPVRISGYDGSTVRHAYDPRGNRTSTTDPAGRTTHFAHDDRGHLTAVTDPAGAVTRVRCDRAGLPLELTDPLGATTRCTRDALGRVTSVTDPLGATTRTRWSVEGKPLHRTAPDGSTESWTYDGEGNCLTHTDPLGGVSRFEYTHFDLLTARTGPDGVRHEFTHDHELRLTRVTNPQGLHWTYEYDPAGNLVTETDFDHRVQRYTHDAAGRLTSRTTPLGHRITLEHDALGRITRKNADGQLTTYAYDFTDQLAEAVNADTTVSILRDRHGRVRTETVAGRQLRYDYDALGRRTGRITPSGATSTWTYDAAGRRAELLTSGRRITFTRDTAGRETSRRIGESLTLDRAYDDLGRLTTHTVHGHDGALVQRRAYTYRADGNLTAVDDLLGGTKHFELDPVGRVTAVHARNWTETYAYDAAGNQTFAHWPDSHPGPEARGPRTYEGTRITTAGRIRYEHDAAGRVTLRQKTRLSRKPDTWHYTWDPEDRLREALTPDGTLWRYQYDALGRRIAKLRMGGDGTSVVERVDFTWDGTTLCEQTSRGEGLAQVVTLTWEHQNLQPVSQTERLTDHSQQEIDNRFLSIVTDLAGAPTEIFDETGKMVWRNQATLWGSTAWHRRSDAYTPLRFSGQYFDVETGLHYNYFRHYDPQTARYLSSDPLGLAPDPNPVAYVANPATLVDPLGLAPKSGCDEQVTHKKSSSRNEAFREAKRDLGIPVSQQPDAIDRVPMTERGGRQVMDENSRPVMTREYTFTREDGSRVIIQDHAAGHYYGEGGIGDQGPHLNVRPIENPRTGKVPGTAQHYEY